jgi:cytochrome c oxidase cbb3-type subunit III
MAKRELDDHSGVETTGHEWDGIKELDHPLPRWWLYVLYATIVWAIGYWIVMPSWPTANGYLKGVMGYSERAKVDADVAALQAARAPQFKELMATPIEQINAKPDLRNFAIEAGRSTFNDNCSTCHGAGGQGAAGYPSLADNVWLWDGSFAGIEQTLKYGIRSGHDQARLSQMPSFGKDELLNAEQIGDLTEYVMTLSKVAGADASKAAKAATLFQEQCASCHGATGMGDPLQGAPNLTDKEYLYGGTREAISGQIYAGKGGVMPTWEAKLSPETIKSLVVYVHSLGGGK